MKLLPLVLLAMCALPLFAQTPPIEPGVSQQLARWRAGRYSDVRYKLNLTLEKMSPVLKGTIEVRVNYASQDCFECPDRYLILDWRKIRGSEKLSTISNVTVNGRPASLIPSAENHPATEAATPLLRKEGSQDGPLFYVEQNEHLVFRDGVRVGENVIKLDFTSPILPSGSAITRYIDKEDGSEYVYSLFVPSDASTAFPVFDQPDLKARFRLIVVEAPPDWKIVSNAVGKQELWMREELVGEPVGDPIKDGYVVAEFAETKPISTYVFAFAAGPWAEFKAPGSTGGNPSSSEGAPQAKTAQPAEVNPRTETSQSTLLTGRVSASSSGLSTRVYVRKSQTAKFQPHAAEVFRLNREGIEYLEEYFDYKFPFPKYDIVLIPEFPFGGMEHAGATFLREASVIFPTEPTANDQISRANVIFHEAAHQWFGDTVTMRWFDDLWLKEGFAEFMAYKTLERVMPEYNAWKAFYERNKPAAYQTDSTRGTTPIYQEIANLSAAKSAYGNIVYRKAPSFLRQADFYLGPEKFQTAVRAFLKKHEYANAGWEDLVKEFEAASRQNLTEWANNWVTRPGLYTVRGNVLIGLNLQPYHLIMDVRGGTSDRVPASIKFKVLLIYSDGGRLVKDFQVTPRVDPSTGEFVNRDHLAIDDIPVAVIPNYQDYGYGIFLLDPKSREYVLKNIQNEKDDFLRSMMWGALWDSVREAELDPREYVELAIKNLPAEKDEMIASAVLNRVSTAMTYYVAPQSEPPASAGGTAPVANSTRGNPIARPPAHAGGSDRADVQTRLEAMLIHRMRTAPILGQRITYYRAFLNVAATENARNVLKTMLRTGGNPSSSEGAPRTEAPTGDDVTTRPGAQHGTLPAGRVSASIPLKTKDRFDIVTRLAILNDSDAPKLLADLEKTETSDDAKRYAYAARAAFPTKENRAKFWQDFTTNKDISESWIEAAMNPFNSPRHADLSLPYLERSLKELPNHKRNRKIFFVNGWLAAFVGGQKSRQALDIVNKFLADNPDLDRDLRLKILENVDVIERSVKIRSRFGG